MKLEQQVVSLDLAKRLKELGVKQESEFYWNRFLNSTEYQEQHGEPEESWRVVRPFNMDALGDAFYSALTVAELGEMLPAQTRSIKVAPGDFYCNSQIHAWPGQHGETEADSRARMLVFLLENDLFIDTAGIVDLTKVPDHDCHASSEDGCEGCGRREV